MKQKRFNLEFDPISDSLAHNLVISDQINRVQGIILCKDHPNPKELFEIIKMIFDILPEFDKS